MDSCSATRAAGSGSPAGRSPRSFARGKGGGLATIWGSPDSRRRQSAGSGSLTRSLGASTRSNARSTRSPPSRRTCSRRSTPPTPSPFASSTKRRRSSSCSLLPRLTGPGPIKRRCHSALGGRLLTAETPLRRRLDEGLVRAHLAVSVRSADRSPVEGAVMLGSSDDPGRYGSLVHRWRQEVVV